MCFRYIHPNLLNRRLEIYKRYFGNGKKTFSTSRLCKPSPQSRCLTLIQILLRFQDNNMFFVYPVTNITIHALNKLFLTIFWCISAVETAMPWCKRSKKDDVTIHCILLQINAQGYIGALT